MCAPVDVERAGVDMFNGRQPRARRGVFDQYYRDGHCARLLRLRDIPPGHIAVSSFVCAFSDLRLICVTSFLAQVKQIIRVPSHQSPCLSYSIYGSVAEYSSHNPGGMFHYIEELGGQHISPPLAYQICTLT